MSKLIAPRAIVWGASGHARVVADIINLAGQYELVGFVEDAPRTGSDGLPFLGDRSDLARLHAENMRHMIMGIGDCDVRLNLAEIASVNGFEFITAIHPSAVIAEGVTIGEGSVVVAGAVINPGAKIGRHVIINTSASVDHDCLIEDGVHIGPGVHLGGGVTVGRATWIGIGAVVKDHVKIGAGSVIGAGAVVLNDIPDGVVAYGVPAKVQRKVKTDD